MTSTSSLPGLSSLPRLSSHTVPERSLLHRRAVTETGVVHLGLGNFHRAHQAVYTAAALDHADGPWGILGVASRSTAVADALREQGHRYSVVEISPEGAQVAVPAVHTGALVAAHHPDAVVDAIAAPGTRIVSLTVTEHGYTFSPRTGHLDLDHEGVQADLRGDAPPRTTIGQVVRGLQRRLRDHATPVTVLSCDNLAGNGTQTARLVREFAEVLPRAERDELVHWLDEGVAFPNTMVDRIVPATTDAYRTTVADHLHVRDEVPVAAEPFTMWVLQDRFAAGRPGWEHGGALFTDDVEPYELLKLRLLNGTHSLIAYLGALDGRATIPDAIGRPFVAEAAHHVLHGDYLPSLTVPDDIDLDAYVAQLFDRWANSALGHRTRQVGSDGSVKLRQRVPDPALRQLRGGRMPHHLALTVAAYLCCMAPPSGYEPGPHAAAMADPARGRLREAAEHSTSVRDFVAAVIDEGLLGDGLAEHSAFTERVAELIGVLTRHGTAAAAGAAAEAADAEPLPAP
ncbi:mannitol dehydrogenase family protein [Streptomyces sporangiiformans]|uniref:Mannitol-1-phosphate 5-dehydrogenase n=1 Tax=Streptomyces sporangiiformans TaxID=2315329 RepID=A0A505DRS3_9ACTN|nr:mannitol dehydrogenase family protein [Streptomyces sporangiiformans]TPQ23957.1 mannitol dehydrogenase family protein [Streptomyces sporangiiformans]